MENTNTFEFYSNNANVAQFTFFGSSTIMKVFGDYSVIIRQILP